MQSEAESKNVNNLKMYLIKDIKTESKNVNNFK